MKHVTNKELLKAAMKENQSLRHQVAKAKSDIDYVAMMTDVEIDTEEGSEENEQV